MVRPDGTVRWIHDRGFPIRDDRGHLVAMTGLATDITERKHAEQAAQRSLAEVARAQRLLLGLSQAGQAVQRARTPEEVYQTVGTEVINLGYNAVILNLSQDKTRLELAHVTLAPTVVRAGERLTGLSHRGFTIPVRPGGFYERVLKRVGTTYAGVFAEHLGEALPGPVRQLAARLADVLGLDRAIYAPLAVGGQPFGLLAVYGGGLAETDVAAVTVFANQAAIALENARLFEEVAAGQERAQALSRQLVVVQEAERRHIARELHDEIGQVLTGLNLLLSIPADAALTTMEERLDEARALVEELMTTVDELSLDLRPAMLDDLGLLPALLWHVDRYSSQTGVSVSLEHAGLERRFSAELETAAYRVMQEALTNVARHAGVDTVAVRLWADDGGLVVQVEDLGTGFDPQDALAAGTSGLSGMYERVSLSGGKLALDSSPGDGTCLTAEWPFQDACAGIRL
jgi:signal transduction histidine kinase